MLFCFVYFVYISALCRRRNAEHIFTSNINHDTVLVNATIVRCFCYYTNDQGAAIRRQRKGGGHHHHYYHIIIITFISIINLAPLLY